MANVLKSLKEKFPDVYNLLLQGQRNHKNLIFFGPHKQLYAKDSLGDKLFYYHHIFQKSKFNPTLYTNFYGKVLKLIKEKVFQTYLGWTREMTINIIEEGYNEDNLYFYQTDGICIEKDSEYLKIKDKDSLPVERCSNSSEYLNYYSKYNDPKYISLQNGIRSMDSFIFSLKNNYLLIKGYEDYYSRIFQKNISKIISDFSTVFRNKSEVAREYVDSYIFSNIYDLIMDKLASFYVNEQKELKKKLDENIVKFGTRELKLDSSLSKCTFSETFQSFENLKAQKTSYEKSNCLIEINNIMIKEAETIYESENEKKFDVQGDVLAGCWIYILAKYMHENDVNFIYLEYLFFKYFQIGHGYEKNDYIRINFIGAMESIQNDLQNIDNNMDHRSSTEYYKVISFQ